MPRANRSSIYRRKEEDNAVTSKTILATLTAAILLGGFTATVSIAATAEENFQEHCAKCHGEEGRGDGPAADVLDQELPDFTDCEYMKTLSDEYLTKIISEGGEAVGKSRQMPAGKRAKLAEEDIEPMVNFVRSLCQE